jgi:hypothetical protein
MKRFAGNERLCAAVRSRARLTHGTVVAYVALFFALGGSGYAATQLGGHSKGAPVAHAARGSKLKVHCTATNGGKKVKCVAVTGVVVGPRGPQGPPGPKGPPGNNGTSTTGSGGGGGGTTIFEQPPAYAIGNEAATVSCTVGTDGFSGSGAPTEFDQTQSWSASSNCAKGNGYPTPSTLFVATGIAAGASATFTTYLQTPSEVDGTASDLDSVQFCYGDANDTAGSGADAQSATMTITRAQVYEIDEPAAASSGSGAPPYTHELLLNDTLDLAGGSNCATVKPASTAKVDPSGYLMFRVFGVFSATKGTYSPANYTGQQVYTAVTSLTLGRITTTYGP